MHVWETRYRSLSVGVMRLYRHCAGLDSQVVTDLYVDKGREGGREWQREGKWGSEGILMPIAIETDLAVVRRHWPSIASTHSQK